MRWAPVALLALCSCGSSRLTSAPPELKAVTYNMYYGLALQWQVPRPDGASDGNLYFFLQAMGRNTYGFDPNSSQPLIEVMPGVQWRVSDNCWLSLGGTRHGLVSCYWHF